MQTTDWHYFDSFSLVRVNKLRLVSDVHYRRLGVSVSLESLRVSMRIEFCRANVSLHSVIS